MVTKHCILCCSDSASCPCVDINEWGSSSWCDGENFTQVVKYLNMIGHNVHSTSSGVELCKNHYVLIRKLLRKRACSICKCNESSTWFLGQEVSYLNLGGIVKPDEWLCNDCHTNMSTPLHTSKYAEHRSEVLSLAVKKIEDNIGCLVVDILDLYKNTLLAHMCNLDESDLRREVILFKRWIVSQLRDLKYDHYSQNKKNVYAMFFDGSAVQGRGVDFLFKTLNSMRSNDAQFNDDHIDKLRAMIKNQSNALPKSQNFDFRTLFAEDVNENAFDKYINPRLLHVLSKVTTSDNVKDHNASVGKLYDHGKKLKLVMVIAILTNAMDPRNTFLQTLLGLACYAQGLRDKGFRILNAFGVVCSIFHVRKHGSHWARLRSALTELDPRRFWRLTFDNLDFRTKFAKKVEVRDNSCILNRMFHLLTSQVTFRKRELDCNCKPETIAEITSVKPSQLKEKHFKLDNDDGQWTKFYRSVFRSVCDVTKAGSNFDSVLIALRSHMTHWTPIKRDVVVYTTVEEAYSGSCDDVSKFLVKLRKDLKIGEEGYPKYVVVAGDQQTYAHMSNLKLKYPGHYDWVYTAPGDWHILKNSAELIKSVLLDGGFRCFSRKCGHKGDITQWQDIHNVLVVLYEAQIKQAVYQYCKLNNVNMDNIADTTIPDNFWTWIKTYNEKYMNDQLSSFWAQMLIYLHAYVGFYFAVRSGNWFLRNSCLKVISELYFAYSRNKY